MNELEKVTVRLLRKQPFYASIIMQLRREITTAVPTMAVGLNRDLSFSLFVNEQFLASLKPEEQEAVLIHECLHLINLHLLQEWQHKVLANLAMDMAINQYIPGLPAGCIDVNDYNKTYPKRPLDKEETAVYYYNKLLELQKDWDSVIKQLNGGKGITEIDDHNLFTEDNTGIAKEQAKQLIESVVNEAKRTNEWGRLPAGVQRACEDALKAQVDWRKELRRFVGQSIIISDEPSRKRYNRRYGFDQPGKKVVRGANVLVVIDTSGSITDDLLSKFMAEINAICQFASVHVMDCDADIHSYEQWKRNKKFVMKGGGGTSFKPPFEAINNGRWNNVRVKRPNCLIYLTDGYGDWPVAVKWPVSWVICTDVKAPFGKTIHIEA